MENKSIFSAPNLHLPYEMEKKVDVNVAFSWWSQPGEEFTLWIEPMDINAVRWFTAHSYRISQESAWNNDQTIAITDVFHIMKGTGHEYDGSGGTGDLQVNITIQNRSGGGEAPGAFLLMAETV